jgi:fructose-bisphosphate aldolase, class II
MNKIIQFFKKGVEKHALRDAIHSAQNKGVAVGHFNFSTYEVARAIVLAGKELKVPVILGLSEGERDFAGLSEAAAFVKSMRESTYEKVFLNADHTYTFEKVKEAVEAGCDMVIYDGAGKSMEENITLAKKCKKYIDDFNVKNNKDILFECELGYIGTSSKVLTELPQGLVMTTVDDAKTFIDAVRPDLLAPAVGNVHGMLKDMPDPNLDEKRVGEIFNAIHLPLVLHGASGNSKEDIQACIKNGVAVVHVNTEIRVSYKGALKKYVVESDEVAPYKYMQKVQDAVQKTVVEKLKIFNFLD